MYKHVYVHTHVVTNMWLLKAWVQTFIICLVIGVLFAGFFFSGMWLVVAILLIGGFLLIRAK